LIFVKTGSKITAHQDTEKERVLQFGVFGECFIAKKHCMAMSPYKKENVTYDTLFFRFL